MINILEIPDQYFLVWDRERHEAIRSSLELIKLLKIEDSEQNRKILHEEIKEIVGFRKAERLAFGDFLTLEGILLEQDQRQQYLKKYLEQKFYEKAREAASHYPINFSETEIKRDAVFYTLARSGLIAISESIGIESDWEQVSGEIVNGSRLSSYLPSEIIRDVVLLLPYAIMYNNIRDKLKANLKIYSSEIPDIDKILPNPIDLGNLNLDEKQRQHVEGLLERCAINQETFSQQFVQLAERLELDKEETKRLYSGLKKLVGDSAFRLARSISELQHGIVDEKVLPDTYKRRQILFPLASKFTELGLKEYSIDHVHTHNARYASMIISDYLSSKNGILTKMIKGLGIEDVSKWQTKGAGNYYVLDPILKPESRTLGFYVGYFLFGHGSEDVRNFKYSATSREREWFLDLLEEIGIIENDLSKIEKPTKDICDKFGRETKSEKTMRIYSISKQFHSLTHYALDTSRKQDDVELTKAALFGWLDDRANKRNKGVSASLKPEYEEDIRRMAQRVGLRMSEGSKTWNKKIVYIINPEIIGYNPS